MHGSIPLVSMSGGFSTPLVIRTTHSESSFHRYWSRVKLEEEEEELLLLLAAIFKWLKLV
ncbi:hypothetical protein LguiA_011182 [Lonicera macranthoides]